MKRKSVLLAILMIACAWGQRLYAQVDVTDTYLQNADLFSLEGWDYGDDGYNYTPLNYGAPVIKSDTIALTGCVRDPHILRGEDGKTFYMVVTDMKSSLGWSSNRGMVIMKSTDLIHWTHSTVHFPTKYPKTWRNVIRVWAPETIYDHQAKRYMVFYSLRTDDPNSFDRIY